VSGLATTNRLTVLLADAVIVGLHLARRLLDKKALQETYHSHTRDSHCQLPMQCATIEIIMLTRMDYNSSSMPGAKDVEVSRLRETHNSVINLHLCWPGQAVHRLGA